MVETNAGLVSSRATLMLLRLVALPDFEKELFVAALTHAELDILKPAVEELLIQKCATGVVLKEDMKLVSRLNFVLYLVTRALSFQR